jgi:DinB superfamily
VSRARTLPERVVFERVDDEWSFVETLRHLILATDCWLRRMVKGMGRPYHPWGLAGSWLADAASWGIDPGASPSLGQVLEVRRGRMDEVAETIAAVTPEGLERVCIPPDSPGHPTDEHTVRECLGVILNEEWEHNRYANRDLEVLEGQPGRA